MMLSGAQCREQRRLNVEVIE